MRVMGAWIAAEFGVEDQSRSGLIALLHRVGMEYRTPEGDIAQARPREAGGLYQGVRKSAEPAY